MKRAILIVFLFAGIFLLNSCTKDKVKQNLNVGKLEVYCDSDLLPLLEAPLNLYPKTYEDVKFSYKVTNARECMNMFLSGRTNTIILARNYLKDEDSLMKIYNVKRTQINFAKDGLVFFKNADSPIDSLDVEQVYKWLTNKNYKLSQEFKNLGYEPELVALNRNTSLYANLSELAARNKPIVRSIKYFSTMEEIKKYVKANPQAIGVAYLSSIFKNPDFLAVRIGFTKKDGTREAPQIVHPSWVIMERYPYIVNYYVYIVADVNDIPNYFATFIKTNADVTKGIFEKGAIPEHAKFNLIAQ